MEEILGIKIYKDNLDVEYYSSIATKCNESGRCTIEDMGDYYEVVALDIPDDWGEYIPPEPQESVESMLSTMQEQLIELQEAMNFLLIGDDEDVEEMD